MAKYDATRIIGYLHEEVIEGYIPENEDGETPEPVTAYRYTGTERDGGTLMLCADPTNYGEVTNAIIRTRYTESEEMAVHRHHANNPGTASEEWQQYNDFCESAKQQARRWLGIQ